MTTAHPNLIHSDDVRSSERDLGELRSRRWRLGDAAGARRIGISRWQLPPGGRSTPVHVHADEEEICFVIRGSGRSWQDGRTYAIAAGDTLVHRAQAEAHTLIAGADGLDVLMFGDGSPTNLTWLPRAKAMWAGNHWLPIDGPHPFEAEVKAGPLDAPDPEPDRPATIVALDDVAAVRDEQPGYHGSERNLGRAAGSVTSGLRHVVLEPGQLNVPPHWHQLEEEAFVILGGSGLAWLGDERLAVRPGSVLLRPPATKVAHALEAGDEGLTYLAYGTRDESELVYYPRSQKFNIGGMVFRAEQVADYYEGESGGARP